MLASASTTSFTGARVVSKTTARRAKRAVAARAGQYDDELLETAVRDRRRERTGGADGGTDADDWIRARVASRARRVCSNRDRSVGDDREDGRVMRVGCEG